MENLLFLIALTVICGALLYLGCRYLPAERWQVLAAVPVKTEGTGSWHGFNLTWYGLLTANAYVMALLMLIILLRSVAIELAPLLILAILLLGLCVPASRWVAKVVEGKAHTFTVGGAVFVGIVAAPWLIFLINLSGETPRLPMLATLAALGIAYAMGEGLGRLACISFGCCYGKPLSDCSAPLRKVFQRFHFVFHGENKKISYASGLQGQPVVPIQAITAILYVAVAVIGSALFLLGHYSWAFMLTAVVTQGWRVFSEVLRADYRGNQRFSAYQWMGGVGMAYVVAVAWLVPGGATLTAHIGAGLASLWSPLVVLSLQAVWVVIFWYTGKSTVTGATMSFFVHDERI
ncbi:prolipoprotein diacylglyceryl transferase family protein [uncultured Desulfuromonas sp.]|uniref:prolipoprotein diacylglyceryl transferase family protein n=1 Tax=uncultured Desulfuromonas sp. TaxID=181013 RepID=UPI002AAAD287|nr:prolipoprotein diacylglyceryl transferase family protein [uncultured Desulfuromonas sp.]